MNRMVVTKGALERTLEGETMSELWARFKENHRDLSAQGLGTSTQVIICDGKDRCIHSWDANDMYEGKLWDSYYRFIMCANSEKERESAQARAAVAQEIKDTMAHLSRLIDRQRDLYQHSPL